MAIDGILLAAVNKDLKDNIIGGRIDKIYQPEEKMITMTLRQPGEDIQLLISTDPENSRVHISEEKFKNPQKPPSFCMLLRKHLLRGIVEDIYQPDFERILHLKIKNHKQVYTFILEIMGRYSNAILIDGNKTVLDALKRITEKISRERELYPGIEYQAPPPQDKLNPLKVNKHDFFEKIPEDFQKYCFKALYFNFRGIGPNMAREIVYRANVDYEQPFTDLSEKDKNKIWESFNKIFTAVSKGKFKPVAGIKDEKIEYLSAFPLKHKDNTIRKKEFDNTNQLFDYYYQTHVKRRIYLKISRRLKDIVENYLEKNKKQQRKFRGKIKESKNADKYKKKGELITANIYQIDKGTREVSLTDYTDSEQKKIKISLDPELSPAKNAQKYYKKYDKAKKGLKYLKKELGKLRHEEKYLEQVLLNIKQAENKEDLFEIEDELKDEGYIDRKKHNKEKKKNKKLPPHKFKSSQGYDIMVGRNNRQNDKLTKKIANDHDIWLHTKKIAGSHVIIRNHTKSKIPEKTIQEAARLAAYYSKARMSENVPIDYTNIKNVNKPKGAKPGLVYYDDYQTIYVDPKKEI